LVSRKQPHFDIRLDSLTHISQKGEKRKGELGGGGWKTDVEQGKEERKVR